MLIVLGIVLFVLEATVTSHGLLAIGGIVCFVLGASALYTDTGDPTEPIATVALPVIVVTTALTGSLMVLISLAAIRTRRMAPPKGVVGVPVPLGTEGVVQSPLEPFGTAYLAGESWSARTADTQPLPRETPVRLVASTVSTAIVEPTGQPVGHGAAQPPTRPTRRACPSP